MDLFVPRSRPYIIIVFFLFSCKTKYFPLLFFFSKIPLRTLKIENPIFPNFLNNPVYILQNTKKKLHLNWLKSIHLRYEINQFILFLFSLLWNELNHLIMHFKNKNKKNTKITGPILFWGKWKLKQKKTLTWFALGKISYNIIQIAFEHTYVFFFLKNAFCVQFAELKTK